MPDKAYSFRRGLLGATALTAALSVFAAAAPARAQSQALEFDQAAQPLASALRSYSATADQEIMFADNLVAGRTAPELKGSYTAESALLALLDGTGLTVRRTTTGVLLVQKAATDPQGGSAAGSGAEVEALIVTAQKREEDIQDVPIAISAFTQEDLERSQVAGGPDLMTQVPNMTFTKTNFSSYSIQIRGIGTQAISATTDAAVAVALNNTPFIRNRFFEQEFYDLQRVEVLRGPQGTLYGRNATAGVVNIISQKPKFDFEAKLSGDVANYNSTRLEGMVNMPLVDDKVALRLAGAWTKRDGYATNQLTGNPIDGRDLWSTRVSLRFAPTDGIDANLIWEHFEENDDRLRSGKQTCKTHEVTEISGHFPDGTPFSFPTTHYQELDDAGQGGSLFNGVQATFSLGCEPSSLYSPDSFQTPNGLSVPYYIALQSIGLPGHLTDPYVSRFQSKDLRVIESTVDPEYSAKSDLAEFQISIDTAPGLTLASETAYSVDTVFSMQDFNRFNTAPGAWPDSIVGRTGVLTPGPNGGIFCDPQIGCADRLVAVDVSSAKSRHFSQEFRLSSDYDGQFNFSLGANFLRYDTEDKYYVFINSLSLTSATLAELYLEYGTGELTEYIAGETDNRGCLSRGPIPPDPTKIQGVAFCKYIDPNPIGSLNDEGHNYFLSRNPYKLISYAVFGEAYYQITENLKLTAGLRWTVDKKEAPTIPSWVLADESVGYPITGVVEQEWREPTGRLTVDWKPDLSFTDETLFYLSLAHGYKAGGANPPPAGPSTYSAGGIYEAAIVSKSATHPPTFEPEFVNAFEVGSKNTLLDGKLTLNTAAFYYDYTGYQISQIVDRSATNLNFDAKVWGLEIEADWRPLENLRLGFKGGYENTRVNDDEKAVDIMNRTAGHNDWIVVRPFPTMTANCILPKWLFVGYAWGEQSLQLRNLGGPSGGRPAGCEFAYLFGYDPVTELPYVPNPTVGTTLAAHPNYPGWDPSTAPHNGEGFDTDLSGNELPNAPHFTATITADYTVPLPNEWLMTLHSDLYYQSEAWTRIFNIEGYDKLKAYTNINLAAIFSNEDAGWKVMAYVKNVMDRDSITGAFLFSDDTGLTTNVFLTEPRLYGLRVTKNFTGGPWWTGASPDHVGPYPLTIELGGQAQRHDAPYERLTPGPFNTFSPNLQDAVLGAENRDLDWGDGREIKVTYAAADWRVSLAARRGEANGGGHKFLATELGDSGCRYSAPCPGSSYNMIERTNYADGAVSDREEHTLIDFTVGRDVGMGLAGVKSTLSVGLRYADFQSTTRLDMQAIPDWEVPSAGAWFGNSQHHIYQTDVTAQREFEGFGPILSWDAAKQLLGDDETGHMDVEWSVGGGVLFGKQNTSATGEERALYFDGYSYFHYDILKQSGPSVVTPPTVAARSRSVTVPVVNASLGLSYEIQRVKIGAGYRWERYYDAVDAGWAEQQDADRAIDGPYFKLAVGFGG